MHAYLNISNCSTIVYVDIQLSIIKVQDNLKKTTMHSARELVSTFCG